MKISVIIPVYNQEAFIAKCLDSVINQSFKSLEIIVVNDGSTDNSRGIIKSYQEQDKRIQLIDQSNRGTYMARRSGFKRSCGDAILNLDADDYLEHEAISLLAAKMKDSGADLVVGDFFIHKGGKKEKFRNQIPKSFDRISAIRYLLTEKLSVHLWGRLYDRRLIEAVELPIQRPYTEDVLTNFFIFGKFDLKLAKVDFPVYNYIIHESNISYSTSQEAVESFFVEFKYVEQMLSASQKDQLSNELALYKSRDWIVYCRKDGIQCRDASLRNSFFAENYDRAKSLLPWYLRLEMRLLRMNPHVGRKLYPIMKLANRVLNRV